MTKKRKKELMELREELKELDRRIDSFTDKTTKKLDSFTDKINRKLDNIAIKLNVNRLILNNIQTNILCNEIKKSCDKMCDTLDRIDNVEDEHNEDSRAE